MLFEVAPTQYGTGAHAPPPLLQMAGHRGGGTVSRKNSKLETDHTVLAITKSLTKTTN